MIIARRFRGPPDSGNGGYSCGLLGTLLPGDVEVTLRSPPPLDVELVRERTPEGAVLRMDQQIIAEAKPTQLDLEVPPPVSFDDAVAASRHYPWSEGHPYPSCFVCGPERGDGDGLRILPGAVPGRRIAAAPFMPSASVVGEDGRMLPEVMFAALDCPSWFGFLCCEPWEGGRILLGRLAARIHERPRAGDRCVATGWFISREGRKILCGSALRSVDGELLGAARATWIVAK